MQRLTIRAVFERAKHCCEYCQLMQEVSSVTFEVDHIIARKHRGTSDLDNLCLSCFYCNSAKGSNIAGRDTDTGELTRLYHPRQDHWQDHFRWRGEYLDGTTDVGRTTIDVLNVNTPDFLALRRALIDEGIFPPARIL